MPVSKKAKLSKSKSKFFFKTKKFSREKSAQNGFDDWDKKTLANALNCLRRGNPCTNRCKLEDSSEMRTDNQIKLRCRQLPHVVQELRKTIMRQDWHEAATLLKILSYPGIKLYSSIIIKVCFMILFSHPNSSLELLQNFIRSATGYIFEEDVNKFIKILLILRKCALQATRSSKYGYFKVTQDSEFGEIS